MKIQSFFSIGLLIAFLPASNIFAETNPLDIAIKESEKYGDYTTLAYDKDKACEIILDCLNKCPLLPVDKSYGFNRLAKLNSMWAKGDSKDMAATRQYYLNSIKVMGDRISLDLLEAKVNFTSLISDKSEKIRETLRLCAWLAYIQLMDGETFQSSIALRNAESLTKKQYEAEIKRIRQFIQNQIRVNSLNVIAMIKSLPNSSHTFQSLENTFLIGALSAKEVKEKKASIEK